MRVQADEAANGPLTCRIDPPPLINPTCPYASPLHWMVAVTLRVPALTSPRWQWRQVGPLNGPLTVADPYALEWYGILHPCDLMLDRRTATVSALACLLTLMPFTLHPAQPRPPISLL